MESNAQPIKKENSLKTARLETKNAEKKVAFGVQKIYDNLSAKIARGELQYDSQGIAVIHLSANEIQKILKNDNLFINNGESGISVLVYKVKMRFPAESMIVVS